MFEERKNNNTSLWRSYGLLIIVIIFVAWLIWMNTGRNADTENQPIKDVVTPNVTQAQNNQVSEGFPSSLLLNAKTEIAQSFSATYPNSSAKQETVIFTSSKSVKANYDFYTTWARDNGWSIVNSSTAPVYSMYLRKGQEDLNITISSTSVTISHINK